MGSVQPQMIVAMKGHPYTGKSTLAKFLAQDLGCVLLKIDDVRSCIATLQQPPPTLMSRSAQRLNMLSFEVVCQTALIQLFLGFSVVLDSPLSRPFYRDRLLQLSTATGARLIIVECISSDKVEWRKRLERQEGVVDGDTSWYMPSTWDDLKLFLEKFNESSNYDIGDIRKLTVETTAHVNKRVSHAVSRLSICQKSHLVDFNQWINSGFRTLEGEEEPKFPVMNKKCEQQKDEQSTHLHRLREEIKDEDDKDNNVTCRKCQKLISGHPCQTSYKCTRCDLILHKSCAEKPHKEELEPFDCLPFLDPSSLEYSFPEMHSCHFHSNIDNGFSYDCSDCLFESHLKCAMLPTVLYLNRDLHKPPLFFFIFPTADNYTFHCRACGNKGKGAFYRCLDCSLIMHVNCALLPLSLKHRPHRHALTLTRPLQVQDGSEEVICDACEKGRDPNHWVYDCTQCNRYTSHLNCVVSVKLNLP